MSVTFGSVGDIIAVCQIVQQIVKALSDTRGSAPEYQNLDNELTSLAELLIQVQSLSKTHEKVTDLRELDKEIEMCRRTLGNVRLRLTKYAASLSRKGSGNVVRDAFWKLKWQTQADQVVQAKDSVRGHYARLQSQLQILGMLVSIREAFLIYADQRRNLASLNANNIAARFDKAESMLLQITDAVRSNRELGDGNAKFDSGTVGGVLVSGLVKSTRNAVELVLSNLPDGPVHAAPVTSGFDQAVSQCQKQCAAIHKHCQKHNTCFRDVDFEIDVDLLSNKKMCLEGLDFPATEDDEQLDPKSVKRVRDVFENPRFSMAKATADDLCYGRDDLLWFQAGLATVLNKPEIISRLCVASYPTTGVYGFVFNRDSEWISSIIDDCLYLKNPDVENANAETNTAATVAHSTRQNMHEVYRKMFQTGCAALYFSQCDDPNETWFPLFEKAYAKAHGGYHALTWGYPGEALEDLTGGVCTQLHTRDIMDTERFWKEELSKINTEFFFSVRTTEYRTMGSSWWTGNSDAPTGTPVIRIYEGHGQRLLLLRSLQRPEREEWTGPWSNRSSEWSHEWIERTNHSFAQKNVFWISYSDLLRKYMYLDRTRIFSPEWRITQAWVALDVAHDDDVQDTYFTFTLQKEGFVVISLSQLDNRYYFGLHGGYYFQLRFHVFKDGEDEYVMHNSANYDCSRSVSGEQTLKPGDYTVRLRISATRYSSEPTLAEVIKKNSKHKRSKLMQLGSHYDVAHAKGLGFAALRAKHAKHECEAAEAKRKAKEKKTKERVGKGESEDEDDDSDQWNAICVAGLKVYSHDPELQLEVRQHFALDKKTETSSVGGSSR